jgi:exonuclease III
MKLVAWNYRGLGNRPTVRGLLDLQKSEGADILFLSEIKLDKRRIEHFRWRLGLTNMLDQKGDEKRGVVVFWRRGIDVSLRGLSQYYIDVDVKEEDGFAWRFTRVYGEAQSEPEHWTWQQLMALHVDPTLPWLCVGDFSEILFSHEKEGGRQRSQQCMDMFRQALEHFHLRDLGYEGDPFTWRNNNHVAEDYIRERLDRAVANDQWHTRFPTVKVVNGDPRHSDHWPLIITTERQPHGGCIRRASGFRFEAGRLKEEQCAVVVEEAWKMAMEEPNQCTHEVIKVVATGLSDWSHNVLGDLEKRIKKLKKELETCP